MIIVLNNFAIGFKEIQVFSKYTIALIYCDFGWLLFSLIQSY